MSPERTPSTPRATGAAPDHQRHAGCLLASACGDALGESLAERSRGALSTTPGSPDTIDGTAPLRSTASTALTLALADQLTYGSFLPNTELDQDALARRLARTWRDDASRGYEAGAVRVFLGMQNAIPWQETTALDSARASGDDTTAPVLPIGLLSLPLNRLTQMARAAARVTHTHPLALDGAALQACAIAYARRSPNDQPLAATHLISTVGRYATTPELRTRLSRLSGLLRGSYTPADVARELGRGPSALETVPAALAAFLHSPDDVAAAVRFALDVGGQSTRLVFLTAGLVGARCGRDAIPHAWAARLEGWRGIIATAQALHKRDKQLLHSGSPR
ncbi:ADP-ribosylglycohydrolase family protein [Nocardiopsis synnemataformans]|uniref:ADP-ribosylglycohydrolase family protein n=1 Tax=Nocardiopsis synnemataformans TaxID=61305 RepID=UPI003EBC0904